MSEVDVGSSEAESSSESSSEPTWWIDEGVPGVGDRPEWLPEKFKSVRDVAKGYGELEKKLGSSTPQPAPEKYEFGDFSTQFDAENAAMKELQDFYKENKVPQDVFSKTLDSMNKYAQSFETDPAAERAKLGEDADARIETLNNWTKANFSEGAFNALTSSFGSAETILAMEEIRNKMLDSTQNPPGSGDNGAPEVYSEKQFNQEVAENLEKYKTDSSYRAELRAKLSKSPSGSNFVDKKGG